MLRRILLALAIGLPSVAFAQQSPDSSIVWVQGGVHRLKAAVYKSAVLTGAPTLVVVLHGDSPFAKPDYQDRFAAAVARRYPNTVVAAILRPGYTDPAGHTSDGERGETNGDNWNAENTEALASAVASLQTQLGSSHVVLVGHSGGAALSANILGLHPELAEAALLVACPCDAVAWRAHMYRTTKAGVFAGEISTLSAINLVPRLSPSVRIELLVGEKDDVAPPALTLAYAAAAQKRGIVATTRVLPGQPHNILLLPAILEALRPLLSRPGA